MRSAPRYPHRQSLHDWLAAIAEDLTPAGQLLRALPLVEGHWSGAERLALHQRLRALWGQIGSDTREAAARLLDGRYAPWCALLATDLSDATTWQALAGAHLAWPPRPLQLEAPLLAPAAPDYVTALLTALGVLHEPAGRWWALCATLQTDDGPLGPARAADLGDEALAVAQAGGVDGRTGLALLFELAVRSGDEARATATLAACIEAGSAGQVAPRWLRRWLEGPADGAARPLALAAPLEATWLRAARLDDPDWRAELAGALRRDGPRRRLAALNAALGAPPLHARPPVDPAWKLLSALDGAYALGEHDQLGAGAASALRATARLAPAADAALARQLARQHLAAGHGAAAARELAQARLGAGEPASRAQLAALLNTLDPVGGAALAALLQAPAAPGTAGGARSAEAAAWCALAAHEPPSPARSIARAMLARLGLHGSLEPAADDRETDLVEARQRWQALAADPEHAEEARQQLSHPALQWLETWHRDGPGRAHLHIAPRGPANGEWLIVPSCVDSRHSHTQVQGLERALPGHHLLFVHNPEFNWYSDAVFEQLRTLVCERVLTQAAPAQVCCYFGSMGGTGALKLALEFGLRAVVFNPQTDLDLWAAFRPRQRPQLWAAQRDAAPADWPDAAWSRTPVYLACGSGTADRLALQALITRWRTLAHGHWIVEKFADPHHAGLLRRVTLGPVPATVRAAAQRLAALRDGAGVPEGFVEVPADRQAAFWDLLDAELTLKIEIVLRDARLWVRSSDRCETR